MNDLSSVTMAAAPLAVRSTSLTASRILTVAEALQPDLMQGFQIDALRLRLEMERAFGGSDATGAWDWKLAYEAGEVALVIESMKNRPRRCRAAMTRSMPFSTAISCAC